MAAADEAVSRRRRGALSSEDHALWRKVVSTVTPLRAPEPEPPNLSPPEASLPPTPAAQPVCAPRARSKPRQTPALAALDRRTLRDLARGRAAVEDRVDLHGLTQAVAHDRLYGFLAGAQARGLRFVLVITGKGRSRETELFAPHERGVLRRIVPQWLAHPELRSIVLGFETAQAPHGGQGAFYVRLRRRREKSA